jgi:hypothetical protein
MSHYRSPVAAGAAAGLVWWQRGQDYYGGVQAASDILGLLFFILLFPSMRALFRALFTFPNEYRMLLKVNLDWLMIFSCGVWCMFLIGAKHCVMQFESCHMIVSHHHLKMGCAGCR